MSDILIKNMEMPKKGEYRMTLYVCDDGYAYMDVDLFPVDKDRFEAVPVPPHGRLIDADWYGDPLRWQGDEYSGLEIVEMIKDWETIIEAEDGT